MQETLEHIPAVDPREHTKSDRAARRRLNLGKFRQSDFFQESREHLKDNTPDGLPARDTRRALAIDHEDMLSKPEGSHEPVPAHVGANDILGSEEHDLVEANAFPEDIGEGWAFIPAADHNPAHHDKSRSG
jgi:hypothetical protein